MSTGRQAISPGAIADAIGDGLAFLAAGQLASGEFPTYRARDLRIASECVFCSSPFATALIANSLGFSDAPTARAMLERALHFLRAAMEPRGVWRFWTADRERRETTPPDADDTACVSHVLSRAGVAFPDNRRILLANRDPQGLFYTWLMSPSARNDWAIGEASADDVDCVVNANVLLYLGDRPATRPVSDYLVHLVREGQEGGCDKWYRDRFPVYYAISRGVHAGVQSLHPVRDEVIGRIVAAARPDGTIGLGALDTALAASALQNLCVCPPALDRALAFLAAARAEDGGWPIAPLYCEGPSQEYCFGSRELTTGLCLEPLLRCRQLSG
jgi:hypothetical protein